MTTIHAVWKRAGYALLNTWLVYHLFAVFIAPAGMPPSSPLLVDVSRAALPYNQMLFLNHGYHFFAPDPGSSTLISYVAHRTNDVAAKGRIPDTTIRPRLLYHRYFMLAENAGAFPPDIQQEAYTAYAKHFSRQSGTDTVFLARVSHEPSSIARIQAGGKLSDPETFYEEPIGFYDFRTTVNQPITANRAQLDF